MRKLRAQAAAAEATAERAAVARNEAPTAGPDEAPADFASKTTNQLKQAHTEAAAAHDAAAAEADTGEPHSDNSSGNDPPPF